MTTEQKIEEILQLVREERERNDRRFGQIDDRFSRIDDRFNQIDAHFSQIDARLDQIDTRFHQNDRLFKEEREINNSRFTQLATGLMDLRKEMNAGFAALNAKVDKSYDSLSQDIQVFAQDLEQVKRRVGKIEKKIGSTH